MEFFISPYISLEGNIFLILAVLVVAVIQFSTADFYFGSAKGAKCLGWYKPQASKVEEDGARQENGEQLQNYLLTTVIRGRQTNRQTDRQYH